MPPINTTSVKVDDLKKLFSSKDAAKALFSYCATRNHNAKVSTVDRLLQVLNREGYKVKRWDLIEVLKDLQNLNCGKFKKGRTVGGIAHPSRFEWEVQMISVAQAALGNAELVKVVTEEDMDEPEIEKKYVEDMIQHSYQLRPNCKLLFDLPINFSEKDAARFADFIKTLPFDGHLIADR